jgi:predicted nucleotidyltransferase component of viral defense system
MFENSLIKAAQKDIDFYEKLLYPLQDEIFALIQTERFYLSGGTCLSRFYYNHRYSEDLDLFYDGYQFPKEEFEITFREIINRISEQFKTELTVDGEYFKRLFVYKKDIALKIEFIFENFKTVGKRKKINKIYIDSKENIAANKITTIYARKTARDFFDLYFLLQELNFEQVAKWSEYKIVPLDYEGAVMAFADQELEGSVLTRSEISLNDFESFVERLIKKMIQYAKKVS